MTDSPERQARVRQIYRALPHEVFDAWITPSTIRRWLFADPTSEIVRVDVDARVGGTFSILERGTDGDVDHIGQFLEIDRPNRLVYELRVPRHFPGTTRVTVEVSSVGDGAELVLTQAGVPPEVTEMVWRNMLARLAGVLATPE